LKNYEKKHPSSKEDPLKASLENSTKSLEYILKTAPELPTGIAIMRGLSNRKNGSKKPKHRCTSQKRKRKALSRCR
jgi:hypothetical protein